MRAIDEGIEKKQLEEATGQASVLVTLEPPAGKIQAKIEFEMVTADKPRISAAGRWQLLGIDND
jgi:hypothetical protein